ncbi:hypothetical protein Ancab_004125 [Ancistrocladus abbreviatus]
MGNDEANFVASNTFNLSITGPEYYQAARLAPASLKYCGICFRKGSYRVKLHFAEIMFSANKTFSSVGRCIFDVSIQGNVVLKDFNIMEKAGGVDKGVTMEFKDIRVNGSTLEISLYWAGKGTNAIPDKGVYGPLISAIEVTPNFKTGTDLSTGALVGMVIGSCAVLASVLVFLRMKGYFRGKDDKGEGTEDCRLHLEWPTRLKKWLGIARGLAYLHEESRLKIVHGDIKATNVLLDKDLNAKISDFGLAKHDEEENTHISTRIAGLCECYPFPTNKRFS